MPTTTNFGWTTPADTDYVKDGASAIRTLGNGIDSSLLDLKGGTTDQVLAKNSNTDLDYKWVETGAWKELSTTSLTGAQVDVTFSTAYNNIRILIKDAVCATSTAEIRVRLGSSSTIDTGTNYGADGVGTGSAFMDAAISPTGSTAQQGIVSLDNYADTVMDIKFINIRMAQTVQKVNSKNWMWNSGAVATNIARIYPSTGNWTSGTVVVLGRF